MLVGAGRALVIVSKVSPGFNSSEKACSRNTPLRSDDFERVSNQIKALNARNLNNPGITSSEEVIKWKI